MEFLLIFLSLGMSSRFLWMSQPRTDFHGVLVSISLLRNEFKVCVGVPSQDIDFHWILVSIPVFTNELEVYVDVPSPGQISMGF